MFGFPAHTKTTYKSNFLRSITLQLKFSKNEAILANRESLLKILSPLLPNCRNLQTNTITLSNVDNKTQITPTGGGLTAFSFSSKDFLKEIIIKETDITVNYNGQVYANFESMWAEINPLLTNVFKLVAINEFSWVSIRKINLIQMKITEPTKVFEGVASVFNNSLIQPYLDLPSNELLNGGLSNFVLNGDGKNLKITVGLMPSKKVDKELVLDIDLFCDNQKLAPENLESKLTEINKEIYNIFHWSLLDRMIQILNS